MRNTLGLMMCLAVFGLNAQVLTVDGYVRDMQGLFFLQDPLNMPDGGTFRSTTYNQVHNRFNFQYRPSENLRFETGVRNRIVAGKLVGDVPGYASEMEKDDGLVDLSWNWTENANGFMNTSVDRLYVDYTWKKIQFRAGRQRINWGINLVWNPNDLFNAFSYMDFDYDERPGSDAVLLTCYLSSVSSLDVACKSDKNHQTTFATRYLFNVRGWDVQFIGGKNAEDFVLGGGWSGQLGKVAFRGEGTYFRPLPENEVRSKQVVSATVSLDYTFRNALYVHSSFLFNGSGTTGKNEGISLINPNFNWSARHLSIGKWECFGQVSYPFSPLWKGSLVGMFNPSDRSSYLGPSVSVSLKEDVELMFLSQILLGKKGSEYGSMGNVYATYCRLAWMF